MSQQDNKPQSSQFGLGLGIGIGMGLIVVVYMAYWLNKQPIEEKPVEVAKVEAPPVVEKKKETPKPKPVAKKPTPKPKKQEVVGNPNEFIIRGKLATGGEPWSSDTIIVRVLWIKNKDDKYKLSREKAELISSTDGLEYKITLKPQPSQYINMNNGVEGNIGRVVAYVDQGKDGKLSITKDKIIAVSKELIRYRSGRFDSAILNEAQQSNIKKEGKGYVIIEQTTNDNNKADWKVTYRNSPAPVHLSAAETHLPKLYTKLIEYQVR